MESKQGDAPASVVSAPGKVLVAGGYLVTQRPHTGLVFSVSARLYAAVRPLPEGSSDAGEDESFHLRVESPQFRKCYRFRADLHAGDSQPTHLVLQNLTGDRNEFIELTLVSVLTAGAGLMGIKSFRTRMGKGLAITIIGDSAFYSAPETPGSEPKKTGLGSSAALVSSVVGALLSYMGLLNLTSPNAADLQLAHNLAQYCHYKAQGKIGSGFDVSSAVFGSQIYTRFSPDVLLAVPPLQIEVSQDAMASPTTPADMVTMLNSRLWNSKAENLRLPRGMHLLLGDISVGAKTPGMVAAVDRWRNKLVSEGKLEDSAWSRLAHLNTSMIEAFREINNLSTRKGEAYDATVSRLGSLAHDKWGVTEDDTGLSGLLLQLRSTLVEIRKNLKEMGEQSGAAIEPDVQTEVCDATMTLPGVVLAGVPGAGGMDALFAVVLGSKAQSAVQKLWSERGISPLLLDEDHNGLCAHTPAEFEDLLKRSVPSPVE